MIKYYSKGYFKKIVLLAFLCCSVVNTFHVYSRLAIGLSWQNTRTSDQNLKSSSYPPTDAWPKKPE